MPSRSSWVDMGGYTAWSLPSTVTPDSRASAATPPMKVPAMPRMWIFNSGSRLVRANRRQDPPEHLVQRANAIHGGELALLAVKIDHRGGLLVVHRQALAHGFGIVVGAAFLLGAAGQALDQQLVVHLQLHRRVEGLAQAFEQLAQRPGL